MRFTSDITVEPLESCGGDLSIARAAWASTKGSRAAEESDPERVRGLIRFLMKKRHGGPFEKSYLSFYVHAPAFVWWEWTRHRIGMSLDTDEFSFNLESGRYRKLEPVFWIPRRERPMVPVLTFKAAAPVFERADDGRYEATVADIKVSCCEAWQRYERLIERGIANEVARTVLPFGVYYSGHVSCNPRSLMHFLSLRTHEPSASFVSFPQAEIEEAARAVEQVFAAGWPVGHAAFNEFGRVAP